MNHMLFEDVIRQINNDDIKKFTIACLQKAPVELEKIPASTTGKYHPEECNAEGGLVIHIRRACFFANMFMNAYGIKNGDLRGDVILCAVLLHDIGKREKYAHYLEYENHPITATKMIAEFKNMIPEGVFRTINSCVLHHMCIFGPKSTKKAAQEHTFLELIVYNSDYLASQKQLEIK